MPSPAARDRFESLLRLPIELWLDETHLRRIRFIDEHRTTTVTFSDFGADVDGLGWSRLPIFRSPNEESSGRSRDTPQR